MSETTPQQVLEDLLRSNLRVVFCGTQAGAASAQKRAYYAGRGNRFWRILKQIELAPELEPADYRRLLEFSIGLTDLCKLTSGPDSDLRQSHFDIDGFKKRIERYSPRIVAFNGKRAASEVLGTHSSLIDYGLHRSVVGVSRVFVLPSTSGAANAHWDARPWRNLARLVRGQS